jgi:proton-dependent oligopeptide transporter, POT family
MTGEEKKVSIFKRFPKTFWVANTIELFERWGWYGFYMLFATYITGSLDSGGLELEQWQKGVIMGVGTGILYFLPVLTGSISDRFGFKNVLIISFIVYITAFISMPYFKSFEGVFFIFLYLALGAALFKPIISATVAKTTNDKTASIGFGIFYMMVNIGGYLGPLVTMIFKGKTHLIFNISAAMIAVNFILLLFYKEPESSIKRETGWKVFPKILSTLFTSIIAFVTIFAVFLVIWLVELLFFYLNYGEKIALRWKKLVLKWPIGEENKKVFENITGVFFDTKFITFLFIVAGFWTMFLQLYFTLPVFISQWVDTSSLFNFFEKTIPFITDNYSAGGGQLEAEFITNFDALYIIVFQILVSTILMKLRPLHSMMVGFLVCSLGMALTLATQNVLFSLVTILILALGEMAGSPKITEYIGRIAPADKKGVYMGYSFIPVFLGNLFAGIISGPVYQGMSDKTTMMKQEAAEKGFSIDGALSINKYFEQLADNMKMTTRELTNYLWDKYHPSSIWVVIIAVGLVAVIALFLYDKLVMKKASGY